jgi:REP element-mobilizing transposase RayT
MADKKIPLEPEKFYHVYNHANGKENLFVNKGNYIYFLKKYSEHLYPYIETYAYCLLPNHFHLLIRVRSEETIKKYLEDNQHKLLEGFKPSKSLSEIISKKFSNLFNAYTQAFNKQQDRMGSLFMPNFKRKEVDSNEYLLKVLHYIHFNPIKHQLVKDIQDWTFTSYHSFLIDKPTLLEKEKVTLLFDNLTNFQNYHEQNILLEELDMP